MGDFKKATAAIAAVLQYIKSEEEAIAMQFGSYGAGLQMPAQENFMSFSGSRLRA